MPVIIKYGRRPVYIVSLLVFGAYSLWAGLAKSYPSELAARLTLGFAGGSADSLAPLTITDIFFLHERGFIMRFALARVCFAWLIYVVFMRRQCLVGLEVGLFCVV